MKITFSHRAGRIITIILVAVIIGALLKLWNFAPLGSLGSVDGQSLEVDRVALTLYIIVPLLIYVAVVRRNRK